MCGAPPTPSVPPRPTPTPPPAEAPKKKVDMKRGRAGTILTGGQGVKDDKTKKPILGG